MVEWVKWWKQKKRITPKDKIRYRVDNRIINFTIDILKQYGAKESPAEGIVYWAGKVLGDDYFVNAAFAPKTEASRYGFYTSHAANSDFVEFICENDLQYISQVHSHPSIWLDHSPIDDNETAFRSEGLVSIVVPSFSINGLLPFKSCGIHRYINEEFNRLSNKYIETHFVNDTYTSSKIIIKDSRYE